MATNKSTIILDAKDKTGRAFAQADSNLRKLDAGVTKLAGTFALLAGGGAIGGFIKSSIDAGDNIQKLSVRLGATTEELSQLEHVAKLSGVSFETMTMGLQRMTRRVAEAAAGTGEAKGAIAELGLSAEQLNKLGMSEKFKALADAIKSVKNPADRVRLAMKLFDSEGVALVQTMEDGSAGITRMMSDAEQLGNSLSDAAARDMAAANDAIARLGTAFDGLGRQIAVLVSGPLTSFIDTLIDFATEDTLTHALAKAEKGLAEMNARFGDGAAQGAVYRAEIARLKQEIIDLAVATADPLDPFGGSDSTFEQTNAARMKALDVMAQVSDALVEEGEKSRMTARDKAMLAAEQKLLTAAQAAGVTVTKTQIELIRDYAGQEYDLTAAMKQSTKQHKDRKPTIEQLVGIENDLNAVFRERQDIFGELKVQYDDIIGSEEGLAQATQAANEVFAEQMDRIDDLVNSDLDSAFDNMPETFSGKMEESTNRMEEIWGNAIENMQSAWADNIYGVLFEDGIDSFEDFGEALVEIFKRALAEMVAAWLASELFGDGSFSFSFGGGQSGQGIGINGNQGGGNTAGGAAMSALGNAGAAYGFYQYGENADSSTDKAIGYGGAAYYGYRAYQSGAKAFAQWQAGQQATQQVAQQSAAYGQYAQSAQQVQTGQQAVQGGNAGAGSGAAAGAAITLALQWLSDWSNSNQAKKQQHYQDLFDDPGFNRSSINGAAFQENGSIAYLQAGGLNEYVAQAFGAKHGGQNRVAFDSQGNRFQVYTDGIEQVQEAMSALTPEIQMFMEAENEALKQSLDGTMKREEAMGLLVQGQKQMAAEFEVSHRLGQTANEEMTNVIIGNFGTIETNAQMVSDAISDGFISSSEAAAAGIDEGAVGMIANLRAIGAEAEIAASKVFTIGSGTSDGGTGETQFGGPTPSVSGRQGGSRDGGFATGGIARGPASGFRPLLHGTEAVVPLGNGDMAKFPVIVQGGGGDEIAAMRKDIRDLKNAVLRRGRLAA